MSHHLNVEEGVPLGVSHGECLEKSLLVSSNGIRLGNYSSGRGTSGGAVFHVDESLAGIHLGCNASLGSHPNGFRV